jgi:O-acetyl-ADP-ribose deacetylase (regulator of RNase III)
MRWASRMKILIRDTDPMVIAAIEAEIGNDQPDISATVGSILDLEVSAVVSPANGFGFMDDGINLVYSSFFSRDLQTRLQDRIAHRSIGELLVGEALLVETGHARIPFLICAPTRRVSMHVDDPVNIMLACRAAVLTAIKENLGSIAFPGMASGTAQAPLRLAARGMLVGIYKGIAGRMSFPSAWQEVAQEQIRLRGGSSIPTLKQKG